MGNRGAKSVDRNSIDYNDLPECDCGSRGDNMAHPEGSAPGAEPVIHWKQGAGSREGGIGTNWPNSRSLAPISWGNLGTENSELPFCLLCLRPAWDEHGSQRGAQSKHHALELEEVQRLRPI